MRAAIPYLFDREPRDVAVRLYERAVSGLVLAGRNEEAVRAARRIRAHVRRAGLGPGGGGWVYPWEIGRRPRKDDRKARAVAEFRMKARTYFPFLGASRP